MARCIVWVAALAALLTGGHGAGAEARPNIVLIIGDDHAWTDYGFMGNAAVRTPHIDKLAATGLTYTRGASTKTRSSSTSTTTAGTTAAR